MQFDKRYNRTEFVSFLKNNFLPEDFVTETAVIPSVQSMAYTSGITKLGACESLDLVVYEIRHKSKHDARVGLSKEAFRFLADEWENRALVVFVPEDNDENYRFSLITIDLEETESGRIAKRYSNPRRYSYFLGKGIAYHTPNKYLNEKGRVKERTENGKQISAFEDLRNRFSVEVLTEAFYSELSDWYAWAVKTVRFPNKLDDTTDDDKFNAEATIRLVTRLIFVWFLKQKHLIPDEFFDEEYIAEHLLKNFCPNEVVNLFGKSEESVYYKAILQNLFFAMLNSPITPEGKDTISERRFRNGRSDYDNNKLMRYESLFTDPDLFVNIANRTVPFLNGGLFDCLDEKDNHNYIDGFSDREVVQKALIVPDYLFFGEEVGKNIDLSEWYGDSTKKKVSARGIIDILKRYNFTVEENTPFDQEVSLDPELLGKVFENLLASYNPETQTTARKQTGSFYTPREIVQYMVDESIIAHLCKHVSPDLETEYRKLMAYNDEMPNLDDKQKEDIINAIFNCKILDPACGSGAFPMGILQQMVHVLSQLDPTNEKWKNLMLENALGETKDAFKSQTEEERAEKLRDIENSFNENLNNPDYARKLYLVENCIYGVDIQPIAIQISKLRFFISLVVDQKSNSNPVDNFGIRPLPNLEAKFVAANSLLGLNTEDTSLFTTEEIREIEKQLQIANHKIFSAKTYRTKRKYRDLLKELRQQMVGKLAEMNAIGDAQIEQLASWDMFNQNACASFFDPEWMFGVKDGFDIVIGNPPYVQLQNDEGKLRKIYENCGFETFASTGDIYCLFYERGYQLLKDGAHLCYITSNKWMRAGYGEKTRGFFASKTDPMLLIDFGGVKVFKSATVDTNILLFAKSSNAHTTKCAVVNKQVKESINNLSVFVEQNCTECDFAGADSWVILSPIEQSIKRKIEAIGKPLKDWDINIYRGVLTGCNEAFIISKQIRDEILGNCQTPDEYDRTAALIRPILRGRDIKRYGYEWADLYLIATFPSRKYDIEDFPSVKKYLLSFAYQYLIDNNNEWIAKHHLNEYCEQKLAQNGEYIIINGSYVYDEKGKKEKGRKKTSNKWFETQDSISYWEDFSKPKILWKRIGSILRFSYVESDSLGLDSTCIATGKHIEYLCCVLNSSMGHYLLKDAPKTGTGDLLISVQAIDPIRVPPCIDDIDFELLLKHQVKGCSKELDNTIDNAIFDLYQLSAEEREHIKQLAL